MLRSRAFAGCVLVIGVGACGLDVVGVATPSSSDGGTETPPRPVLPPVEDASTSCSTDGGATLACDGACFDPMTDRRHCGRCDNACAAWAACEQGACVDVAQRLVAFRQEIACINDVSPACGVATASPPDQNAVLAGTPGATYTLEIRARGVVEQKTYTSATTLSATGTNATFFAQGGLPKSDTWNVYELRVSAPASSSWLNNGASDHTYCDPMDYAFSLDAAAGATVTLHADSFDAAQAKNRKNGAGDVPILVSDLPEFAGQFVQLDVVSVVRR